MSEHERKLLREWVNNVTARLIAIERSMAGDPNRCGGYSWEGLNMTVESAALLMAALDNPQ